MKMWEEVVAAANAVARERAERRGFSTYTLDKKSLKDFKKIIHCRPVATTQDIVRTKTVAFQSDKKGEKTSLFGEGKPCEGKIMNQYSTREEHKLQTKTEQDGRMQMTHRVKKKGPGNRIYELLPFAAPGQFMLHIDRISHTEVAQCELETQSNFLILVHPGHPISKHAAAGGIVGILAGAAVGAGIGSLVGAAVGIVGGPPGIGAGTGLGSLIGAGIGAGVGSTLVGTAGSTIGAASGVAERCETQFSIKAEDVFRKLSNFRRVDNRVFCFVTV